jgi:hypothetical protein
MPAEYAYGLRVPPPLYQDAPVRSAKGRKLVGPQELISSCRNRFDGWWYAPPGPIKPILIDGSTQSSKQHHDAAPASIEPRTRQPNMRAGGGGCHAVCPLALILLAYLPMLDLYQRHRPLSPMPDQRQPGSAPRGPSVCTNGAEHKNTQARGGPSTKIHKRGAVAIA